MFSHTAGKFAKLSEEDSFDSDSLWRAQQSSSPSTPTLSAAASSNSASSSPSTSAFSLNASTGSNIFLVEPTFTKAAFASNPRVLIAHNSQRNAKKQQLHYPSASSLPVVVGDFTKAAPVHRQQPGLTFKVALAAGVSFFTNSLPSGFNMGVVNTPEEIFKEFFNHTMNLNQGRHVADKQIELLWSIAVSLLLVGAFIGCTFTGYLADTIGRRGLLILNATIGLLGVSLCWASKFVPSVPIFMAGRFIAGLHTGVGSSLVPMYLIEIAPKSMATTLGTLHVMGMNGGQMLSQILGLEVILGSYTRWQLMFFVNSLFIILGLSVILMCPESPFYLFVMKRQEDRALQTLQSIRGQSLPQLVDEICILRQEQKNRECNHQSLFQLLRNKASFRSALLVVCILHAGQQLIGINAVFYYSTKTFKSVGLSAQTSQYSSIGCTTLNTVSALLAIPLIRRFALRNLLLVSGTATTVSLAILSVSMTFKDMFEWLNYVTIAIILLYVLMFAIGLGPIPYMIGGELFDQSSMAIGMSIGCFVNWFCNFLIAITFPMMVLAINQYVFVVFLAFNVFLWFFILIKVPNTRQPLESKQENQMATTPN